MHIKKTLVHFNPMFATNVRLMYKSINFVITLVSP
jgi:hypothetical protein